MVGEPQKAVSHAQKALGLGHHQACTEAGVWTHPGPHRRGYFRNLSVLPCQLRAVAANVSPIKTAAIINKLTDSFKAKLPNLDAVDTETNHPINSLTHNWPGVIRWSMTRNSFWPL